MKPKKLTLNRILKLDGLRQIEVPTPDYDSEKELIELIVNEFRKKTLDEELIGSIRFVAGEMINNARYYGNHLDILKKIRLYLAWRDNDFYFVIEDEGGGFDMKNPVIKAGPPESGIGIFYSKQRTDLTYNFGDSRSYICLKVPCIKLKEKLKWILCL